ncbi:MAG TPA: ABC transporter permease subunit, partial [Cryomorphaceae bacterium]|nr:ABC transporter permease subunit [Cryomorphaceae bacterium]
DKIRIDEKTMLKLNYLVEVEKEPLEKVAYNFLLQKGIVAEGSKPILRHPIIRQTIEHLRLTLFATLIAILIAVPLGIYISYRPKLSNAILATTGVIQTIPSLALLGFMIPLFGIGFTPAIIALFLYALLPIVRNTYAGLQNTDPILIEAGRALGMTRWQILRMVRLPLSASFIMAGIRTALTINIGTATLAAFIGAGGLGESIITGINLNDNSLIFQGAIPAALLALLADWGMGLMEKKIRVRVE